ISETPSRQRIFSCHPAKESEEEACATSIISRIASKAFRRPSTPEDLESLLEMYKNGKTSGGFEAGVRTAMQAIIAKPEFVFRFEHVPAGVKPGDSYRISDLELASRLSYFLWSTAPDDQLLDLASQGKLHDPINLEKQVRRMLADSRAETLSTNFASQWLRLTG